MIEIKENNKSEDATNLSYNASRNPRVLILENEAIIAEDLRSRLERMGCSVTAVTDSGRNAIDLAKGDPPDILFLDLDVKGDLNGAETACILQGHFDRPLPVVFVTAFSDKEFPVIKAVEPYLIVKKPFTDKALQESLDEAREITKRMQL